MNLRELMIERILFEIDEEELIKEFQITEEGLKDLSDLDLLELYEKIYLIF